MVFDEFVVGAPCPLLLEAAHQLRLVRRADWMGAFDDEEERWYDEHPDDDDAYWEPPMIPDRVLAAMATGQEFERLRRSNVVAGDVWDALGRFSPTWVAEFRVMCSLENVLVTLADSIRIGGAAVVDARLRGERDRDWGWAA